MRANLANVEEWKTVLILSTAGFVFRILHYFLFANEIVAGSDAMQNIMLGRKFASGNFYGVLDTYWPPLYPILIGTFTFFFNDLIIPTIVVSIVSGSLAIPLTYYFVKQSYGQSPAIIAALVAIFFPYLINSVFAIGTENIYFLCIVGALFVGWRGLINGSAIDYLFTGILLGLGYLTRPEAIGYPFFFVALAVGKSLWQKQLFGRKTILQIAAILLGFTLLSAPYIFYLKSETGSWAISGKTSKNFASGIFDQVTPQNELNQSGEEPLEGKPTVKNLASNFIFNLREAQRRIGQLMPLFLLLLVGLGLFGERWNKERLKREGYLLTFCFLTILGYAATWVLERYLYILLPIFFGWIALGIIRLEQWFRESSTEWTFGKYLSRINFNSFLALSLILIYLYLFPINFYVRSRQSAYQGSAYEERDAGQWLRQNSKPNPNLFAASYRPAFYAEGTQYWTKSEDLLEIMTQIKECRGDSLINSDNKIGDCKIDYVISTERSISKNPFLQKFAEVLQNDPAFELVYEKNEQRGHKISIFKYRQSPN